MTQDEEDAVNGRAFRERRELIARLNSLYLEVDRIARAFQQVTRALSSVHLGNVTGFAPKVTLWSDFVVKI